MFFLNFSEGAKISRQNFFRLTSLLQGLPANKMFCASRPVLRLLPVLSECATEKLSPLQGRKKDSQKRSLRLRLLVVGRSVPVIFNENLSNQNFSFQFTSCTAAQQNESFFLMTPNKIFH